MTLPAWLDTKVWQEIETIEEHKNMKYITSIERIGIAKGRVEGRIEGRVEGRVEGESKLLKRQLERRFGALPALRKQKQKKKPRGACSAGRRCV